MDSATQFLLGASVAGVTLGRTLGPRALLIGGILGTLPDLDSFIPMGNVIDNMTYHRGFSHSVLILTAASPLIAGLLSRTIGALKDKFRLTLLAVWLCLVTHPLLDSLTTYGTQILWPFGNAPPGLTPVAFPAVFIIDPIYTLLLLIGVLVFWRKREPGYRVLVGTLAAATIYLGFGMVGHLSVKARAESHPAFQGKAVHVQPTPFNIVGWQILGVDEKEFVSALTGIAPGCAIVPVQRGSRGAEPPPDAQLPDSVKRLEWFTGGFFSYKVDGDTLILSDMRMGFSPSFVFSFKIAEKIGGLFKGIEPERNAANTSRSTAVGRLLSKVFDTLKTCT
ncbi:MAG: metal-dependent hydrolase [Alphaproteobacteria bacterium]|nr:metal-dependent hydrolase [Alphaproteobacteria bacterium]